MKTALLFFIGLVLFCQQVVAQNVVRVQRYDLPQNVSGYVFADHNFYANRGSFFDVLNLNTGISRQITKPTLAYMQADTNLGPVGASVLLAGENGQGTHLADNNGIRLFDGAMDLRQIVVGTNSSFVYYNMPREGDKLFEIDNTTKEPIKFWITHPDANIKMGYSAKEDLIFFSSTSGNKVGLYVSDGAYNSTRLLQELSVNAGDRSYIFFWKSGEEVYFTFHTYDDRDPFKSLSHVYHLSANAATAVGVYPDLHADLHHFYRKDEALYAYSRQTRSIIQAKAGTTTPLLPQTKYLLSFLGELHDKLLFVTLDSSAADGWVTALYETDGTAAGTKVVSDIAFDTWEERGTVFHNGALYFPRETSQHGKELYKYDGRKVSLVADVLPGAAGLEEFNFHTYKDELYFSARPSQDRQQLHVYLLSNTTGTVQLSTYADLNNNQVKEADEPYLDNQLFSLNDLTVMTNQDVASVLLQHGTHTLSLKPGSGWKAATTSATVTLPADNNRHYSFALVPEKVLTKVDASLVSDATRCGFPTPYTLLYRNSGSTTASGTIKVKPEANFTFTSATPAPDRISGDTLIWQLNNLKVSAKGTIRLNFTMPGVEHMGDTLVSKVFTQFTAPDGKTSAADTTTLQQILTCSYDPNDIQVNPAGWGEKHLTLKKQELEYLIRFQNMGTDKAFNIVVENQLSEALDLSTFKIIGSSHAMYPVLEGNTVRFYFDNIRLPYEKQDEPGSHGYILYRIKPKSGLADSTRVENQAFIYFDYNPAIETNIAFNTLVDKLPVTKSTPVLATPDELASSFTVFPNPARERLFVKWHAGLPYGATVTLLNALGQEVKAGREESRDEVALHLSGLPAGLYFLKVSDKNSTAVKRIVVQ